MAKWVAEAAEAEPEARLLSIRVGEELIADHLGAGQTGLDKVNKERSSVERLFKQKLASSHAVEELRSLRKASRDAQERWMAQAVFTRMVEMQAKKIQEKDEQH